MNSLLLKARNAISFNLRKTISYVKIERMSTTDQDITSFFNKQPKSMTPMPEDDQYRKLKLSDPSLICLYSGGDYVYGEYKLNDTMIEKKYDYVTEDDELDIHIKQVNTQTSLPRERRTFIGLDDKELYQQLFRKDLNRLGSVFLIMLADEAVNRYRYQLYKEIPDKKEKKLYTEKNKKESAYYQKIKHDILKLDFQRQDKISEIYTHTSLRLKLKEKFYFFNEFWQAILNIDDTKLKGNYLYSYINILHNTMCQRLDVWEKFVRCFGMNLREFADETIEYKPMRYKLLLTIFNNIYHAMELSGGSNMPCHIMEEFMINYKDMIINIIRDSNDFRQFEILSLYKFFVNENDKELEDVIKSKLETVGKELDMLELTEVLSIYSDYYEDLDMHEEFSIIENSFIYLTENLKKNEVKKIEYAKKILKVNENEKKKEFNEIMFTLRLFDFDLTVLKNFSLNKKWFPYKYINHFIKDLLEIDYLKNMQLVVEISQLLARFSFYDPDHHKKLMNALYSLPYSEANVSLLFDTFVLSISNSKIDKYVLETTYENIIKILKPHLNPDTPSQFKQQIKFEEIDLIFNKILEYYNNVLDLKRNSHFKVNEPKFGELAKLVADVYQILASKEDMEKEQ